jgi:hypothetical protein
MTHQVSAGEYARCVQDNACSPLSYESTDGTVPAIMVSWNDARAYAAWLSKKLGAHYRLPTDEEWFYAAGSRAPADAKLGAADTVARWLARDDRESLAIHGRSRSASSAPMKMACLISQATSGSGPTPALRAMSSTRRTRRQGAARSIAACVSPRGVTARMWSISSAIRVQAVALPASRRATSASA